MRDILREDWRKGKPPRLNVHNTKAGLLDAVAGEFLELAGSCQQAGNSFSVIMGGGRTPGVLNERIVLFSGGRGIDWGRVFIFFSDERCVLPGHSDSNYKLINDTLIGPLGIPGGNVFRICGELGSLEAASDYNKKLRDFSGGVGVPVIDLALLGFGGDGHTASLFPRSRALEEFDAFAIAAGVGPEGLERVTVTYPVFNSARNVWLIASGEEKAGAVRELVLGGYNPTGYPAQGICPVPGNLVYWFDATTWPQA
ncbi:MAG: 6-phosphogluconolactonase [bacterium]|nr:6-phosphogluconolactonase [bacterium]